MKGYLRPRDRRNEKNRKGPCTRWQLVADIGRAPNGRRKQVFRSFHGTKTQAQAALRQLLVEIDQGIPVSTRSMTFHAVATEWLERKRSRKQVVSATIEGYEMHLRDYILPALGTMKINAIAHADLQDLLDRLAISGRKRQRSGEGAGLGTSALRGIRTVLRGCFKYAEKNRLISYMPALGLELPRSRPSKKQSLEVFEFKRLLAAATNTRLHLSILLGGAMGMRKGEIYGLQWRAVNFKTARMDVMVQVARHQELRAPKGDKIRSIPIPEFVLSALRSHKAHQDELRLLVGPSFNPDAYVFVDCHGKPENPNGINTLYRRLVRDAKIRDVTFHELRHTAGSILLDAGVPLIVVSEILGHDDVMTTARIYAHALDSSKQVAADTMHAVMTSK